MKLFLDANVIFTAAFSPEGVSAALFELARAGRCKLCSSRLAMEEARRNIRNKAPERNAELDALLSTLTCGVEPRAEAVGCARLLPLADKDAPIMAAAVANRAGVLVTGDRRDFGHLLDKTIEGVGVLTPRAALDLVLRESER